MRATVLCFYPAEERAHLSGDARAAGRGFPADPGGRRVGAH